MSENKVVLPWERQEDEPEESWKAFARFRDQDLPRQIMRVHVGSTSAVYAMATDWKWKERVAAYDRHIDEIRRHERETMLKQSEKERMTDQMVMLKKAEQLFNREMSKYLRDSTLSEVSGLVKVSDLNKLMANVIQLQRLIHGESTQNIQETSVDLSMLSVEELRQWRDLQQKVAIAPEEDVDTREDPRH